MFASNDNPEDSAYLPLIDQAIASKRWLTPMPEVFRARYAEDQFALRRRGNRRVIIIMTVIFDLFLLAQMKSAPEILHASVVLRMGVVTPVALAFALIEMRGRLRRLYGPFLVTAAVLPTVVSAVLMLLTSPHNTNAISDIHAIPLILLATGLVARLTPREVYSNVAISVISFCGAASLAAFIPSAQLGSLLLTDLAIGAAAIVFNVQLESRDRRVFLLSTADGIGRAALAARNRGLLAETQTDGLTGVANRRCFDDTLRAAWANAVGSGGILSLIIMDIDHFKTYNDFYGHQGGDECLRKVAAQARAEVRGNDLFARYGGEEFAVILPGASLETAANVAERIRAAIQSLDLKHEGQSAGARVSVSLGAASTRPDAAGDPRRLIEKADANLYAAKRGGRNRVMWQANDDAGAAQAGAAQAG